ncbi:hypothetical protein HID58_044451 [Brassica napus]|uniref:Glycosyltransferases n=1 Tax=Brassica napus TaxID=3708 RepID=A0ABQ8BJI2_BRANA|nr:hypothetical protein HID58_044451 [Brassica napus]
MANSFIILADLKAGRCSNTVKVRLLRFWEARNPSVGRALEDKRISSWWMVDLGEDDQTTFIEQVVADESNMEGVPPACSRILNWHLHLNALDVPYPQGWVIQKNFESVITVR